MSEVKTDLYRLEDLPLSEITDETVCITERHTISDILRYLISQSSEDDVRACLDSFFNDGKVN